MDYTHELTVIELGQTRKDPPNPMWRCTTKDGETTNFFQNTFHTNNSLAMFVEAGYGPELQAMVLKQVITWTKHPIRITMQRSSRDPKYWDITGVVSRPPDAVPDPIYRPDLAAFKAMARSWAKRILDPSLPVLFWDVETTGVGHDDEIVSIGILNNQGKVLLDTLVMPTNPLRLLENRSGFVPSQLTGITPERLIAASAPTFPQIYPRLLAELEAYIWVTFNDFDAPILTRNCYQHGLRPIYSLGVNDAMRYFAYYHGEWSPVYNDFVNKKLEFAAQSFGLSTGDSHIALADAATHYNVVRMIAETE